MNILLYEAKKILIHKRGLLFIGLYLLLCVVSLALFDKPQNAELEANREHYAFYLREFQGASDERTETAIADEYQRIADAEIAAQKLYDGYYNGTVPQDEFERESQSLASVLENQKGFDLLYSQYIYVRENPANRYFVYTNGWNGLLANDSLDIFLVLLVLLLITPVFCYDYESSMGDLLMSMQKGGARQAACKIILALVSVAVLCALSFGIRYAFFALKYGLPNGDNPLQSLSYFATSSKNISLTEAFALISAFKIAGYLSFASIILAVSKLAKKYAITVFSCTAAILLPYFGLSAPWTKYFLPYPLGLMVATGFLRGSEYERDMFTDELSPVFKEVSARYLFVMLAIILIVSGSIILFTVLSSKNKWHSRRKSKSLCALIIICLLLSGCSVTNNHYDSFNYVTNRTYENERYKVYVDETDIDDIRLVFEDKVTGAAGDFVRDPFGGASIIENSVYGNVDFVYYIKYGIDNSKLRRVLSRIFVVEVNLTDFSERVIFEQNVNRERDSFLGLLNTDNTYFELLGAVDSLFVNDGYIYFISSKGVLQVDGTTNTVEILNIPTNRSLAFDGASIYYVNDKSEIVRRDLTTGRESPLPDIIASHFYLIDTELFFINRLDGGKLYSMNLTTAETRKLADVEMRFFYCDRQYIYFQLENDNVNYRMDKDGTNCVMIE